MKVLFINTVCGVGSTGRIVVDMADVLNKNGHKTLICYGRGNELKAENAVKFAGDFSVLKHALLSRITDKQGCYSKKDTKKLIKIIEEFEPDIINLHNIHGYYINYKLLFDFLKVYNKPIVWTFHDCWPFTGHCAHFDFIGCEKWTKGCEQCPQLRSYPSSLLADNSKKNYLLKQKCFTSVGNLTIVSPSQWLANKVKQSFLKKYDIKVINNGVDLDIFNNQNIKTNDKKIVLAVANVWNAKKGFEDVLKIADALQNEAKTVIVGLTAKQKELLPAYVEGIERTSSSKELAKLYSQATVFINPTYEDNYPTVNIEALACGTPVITYKTGGSVEAISSGNGKIVEKGDTDAMIKSIKEILDNPYTVMVDTTLAKKFDKYSKAGEYCRLFENLTK